MTFFRQTLSWIIAVLVLASLPFASVFAPKEAYAQSPSFVPQEYFPNYEIAEAWDAMLAMFIQIQAVRNTGLDLDESFFADLSEYFSQIFPSLPQNNSFRITYEQCRILGERLSQEYSYNGFGLFWDGCYGPLDKAIKSMTAKYTIKPSLFVSPKSGSAPLSVTFDARASIDPSNDTIPSNNFFWYYKDVEGIDRAIGQGPVVNYTFDREGNYIVHLTVRSANQQEEGILDGKYSTSVAVSPEAATMVVYANGQLLQEDDIVKVGSAEAKNGVLIDASATIPKGGRIIQSHTWEISGGGKTFYRQTNDGAPGTLVVPFNQEGQYRVSLSVRDNENNGLKRSYSLIIADPLAIIRQQPEQGNTATTFSFDASSSYSVVSQLRLYTWEIFDDEGQRLDTIQGKSIKKQFKKPGSYAVKLTVEDEQGRKNTETTPLYVDSSDPLAQFSHEALEEREHPSQFELDASLSSDPDILESGDELSYQRGFVPQEGVTINEVIEDGKRLIISFDKKGSYQVKLTVTDSHGKISEVEKTMEIQSSIRPRIFLSPIAGARGSAVKFLGKANKEVVMWEREMGDGTERSAENKLIHRYQSTGVYPVTLRVYGEDDESNSITRNVYVGESGKPIIAYHITQKANTIQLQNDECLLEEEGPMAAYRIERGVDFSIDVTDSVDTKGQKNNLQFFFKPQYDHVFTSPRFSYQFLELGCQYIDITLEDSGTERVSKERVWFKVVNDLPELQDLVMTFPQFGNDIGISLSNNRKKDLSSAGSFDPIIVKLGVNNARDPDGAIALYKRYYFNKDNPSRILEKKVTPANIPEAYFTLQKIPGEYEFGVTLVDNDGGEQDARHIIGHGPSLFFPPDEQNLDIPLVTLRQSAINTKVGEDIEFEVIAKVLSDRSDFSAMRSIKYDFDGDGTIDLHTKKDKVSHYYSKAGSYTPRVKVVYRGIPGNALGEEVKVDAGIRPLIMIENYGPLTIGRDISIGSDLSSRVCMNQEFCHHLLHQDKRDPQRYQDLSSGYDNKKVRSFAFEYPGPGSYEYELFVTDEFANHGVKTGMLAIETIEEPALLYPLTIPQLQVQGEQGIITVGRQLNNTVSYFLHYQGNGECWMDADITLDSNGDGKPDNDGDVECNELVDYHYDTMFSSSLGRIYYEGAGTGTSTRDITVNFLDNDVELDRKLVPVYHNISSFILILDSRDPDIQYLKDLLIALRNQLGDKVGVAAQVITIKNHLTSIQDKLSEEEINRVEVILFDITDGGVIQAIGGTPYEQAKQDIVLLSPSIVKNQLKPHFDAIEAIDGDREAIKQQLQMIIDVIRNNVGEGEDQIDAMDVDLIVMPKVCQMLNYFDIKSSACVASKDGENTVTSGSGTVSNGGGGSVPSTEESGSKFKSILKIIILIIVILGIIFGAMIGVFYVKAKMQQQGEEEEGNESE